MTKINKDPKIIADRLATAYSNGQSDTELMICNDDLEKVGKELRKMSIPYYVKSYAYGSKKIMVKGEKDANC